jgi:hypothetical protein
MRRASGSGDRKCQIFKRNRIVRADSIRLPIVMSGDFGRSPFLKQLSGQARFDRASTLDADRIIVD